MTLRNKVFLCTLLLYHLCNTPARNGILCSISWIMLFVLYMWVLFFLLLHIEERRSKKKLECETCSLIYIEATPLILVCVTYIFLWNIKTKYTKASLGECLLELLRFKGLFEKFPFATTLFIVSLLVKAYRNS